MGLLLLLEEVSTGAPVAFRVVAFRGCGAVREALQFLTANIEGKWYRCPQKL